MHGPIVIAVEKEKTRIEEMSGKFKTSCSFILNGCH
jgi:hypothetical protein